MDDLFKKMVFAGIGVVTQGVDRLQTSLDKLVEDNKISSEEGKKVVDDFTSNISSRREEFEAKLGKISEDILTRMNLATSKRIEALEARVKELEEKHASSEEPKKTTRKKAATTAENA